MANRGAPPQYLYKPGQSGNPTGRPKGAKNKVKFVPSEILALEGCNPFQILSQIAMGNPECNGGKPISAYIRREAASDLCSYLSAKIRALEISAGQQGETSMSFNYAHKENVEEKKESND